MKKLSPITLSDSVVVSDPCYQRDIWCMGFLKGVKPGTYIPEIFLGSNGRVESIEVCHESHTAQKWEKTDFEVGVDSGQAGIFDDSIYPHGETGEYDDLTQFYGKCCALTLDQPHRGGTLEGKGLVSSSGYGDGGYDCEVSKNLKGEIIAIRIIFIPEEEEQSFWDDEEEQ